MKTRALGTNHPKTNKKVTRARPRPAVLTSSPTRYRLCRLPRSGTWVPCQAAGRCIVLWDHSWTGLAGQLCVHPPSQHALEHVPRHLEPRRNQTDSPWGCHTRQLLDACCDDLLRMSPARGPALRAICRTGLALPQFVDATDPGCTPRRLTRAESSCALATRLDVLNTTAHSDHPSEFV